MIGLSIVVHELHLSISKVNMLKTLVWKSLLVLVDILQARSACVELWQVLECIEYMIICTFTMWIAFADYIVIV